MSKGSFPFLHLFLVIAITPSTYSVPVDNIRWSINPTSSEDDFKWYKVVMVILEPASQQDFENDRPTRRHPFYRSPLEMNKNWPFSAKDFLDPFGYDFHPEHSPHGKSIVLVND